MGLLDAKWFVHHAEWQNKIDSESHTKHSDDKFNINKKLLDPRSFPNY